MKYVAIGVHRDRAEIEPVAEAVAVGPLFLSSISVDDDQPLGARELLLRVAAIRGKLLDNATFIAVRYGFTFRSDAEAEQKCAPHLDRWKSVLDEFRGAVELTIKIAVAGGDARPDRHDFDSGTGYLRALHAAKASTKVDPEFRDAVEQQLVPLCRKTKWISRDVQSMEFAALLDRDQLSAAMAAGQSIKAACPRVPFLLSAPWPLEVFADADNE